MNKKAQIAMEFLGFTVERVTSIMADGKVEVGEVVDGGLMLPKKIADALKPGWWDGKVLYEIDGRPARLKKVYWWFRKDVVAKGLEVLQFSQIEIGK